MRFGEGQILAVRPEVRLDINCAPRENAQAMGAATSIFGKHAWRIEPERVRRKESGSKLGSGAGCSRCTVPNTKLQLDFWLMSARSRRHVRACAAPPD